MKPQNGFIHTMGTRGCGYAPLCGYIAAYGVPKGCGIIGCRDARFVTL
jgi:hypothetical protein